MRARFVRLVVGVVVVCATAVAVVGVAGTDAATLSASTNGCDVLVSGPVGHDCLLPWPNNAFTKKAKTATGLQLNLTAKETPANNKGQHIIVTAQDQLDGFSPGGSIMTYVPDLSVANSGIATSTDIAASLNPKAPIVVLNMQTKKRVPYFAELDAQNADPTTQLLLIHPAIGLTEGDRYAVVLRDLKNTADQAIAPAASTLKALKGTLTPASRGAYIQNLIKVQLHGVLGSTTPYTAWDFTVESALSIAAPALDMRNTAFAQLPNDKAPPFTVDTTSTSDGVTTVSGTYEVPLFLKAATNTAGLDETAAGAPKLNGTKTWPANFICVMPSTIQPAGPALPAVYGHGLLGDASEVEGSNFSDKVSQDMMGCATDWLGLDDNDLPTVISALNNLSNFPVVEAQMLQGMLNFQYLGRLINSAKGFATSPAFQSTEGSPLFQVGKCVYVGYSQGAIMGAAVSAISNEWTRAFLGQGGMNYSGLLLQRSVDWADYASILDTSYPNENDQQVGMQLAQLLWDRGEADGYAAHLTSSPLPGTKVKQVFLIENYGDHQVPNVGTDVLARTIGAAEYDPAFARSGDPDDYALAYGLKSLNQTKATNAALELWDFGTLDPPTNNVAPVDGPGNEADPHDFGRADPTIDAQIITFLKTGVVADVCGSTACQATP